MASLELQRLWKLAQIDRQIVEIRKRAANLDAGQKLQAQIDALQKDEVLLTTRKLQQEIIDLELAQKSDEDKLKKVNREIYGGKVVNPREVANLEREVEIIKKKKDGEEERLLELYDLLPPAKKASDQVEKKITQLKLEVAKKREEALAQRTLLEDSFKKLSAQRPEVSKTVSPNLLSRYENVRQNHHGLGMVEIDYKTGNCGGCGMHLPERTMTLLREDKPVVCESCHRYLYYTEGVV